MIYIYIYIKREREGGGDTHTQFALFWPLSFFLPPLDTPSKQQANYFCDFKLNKSKLMYWLLSVAAAYSSIWWVNVELKNNQKNLLCLEKSYKFRSYISMKLNRFYKVVSARDLTTTIFTNVTMTDVKNRVHILNNNNSALHWLPVT
jgi:hypothetical protein